MNASLTSLALAAVPLCLAQSSAAQAGAQFGYTVASADVDGDGFRDLIVGEPFHDGVFADEGRVLVYLGSAAGLGATPSWTQRGHQRGAHFGSALARAGDVNGDGFEDIVIGAPEFDAQRSMITAGPGAARYAGAFVDQGAIFIFQGSASGLSSAPALVRLGVERNERFGRSVSSAGDVDGDGYGDVIVGALGTGASLGGAFLFRGSALGPEPFPSWIVHGDQANAAFGFAVSGIGDFDADGYADVAVGAPGEASSFYGEDQGKVFLYHGSASGLATTPFYTQEGSDGGNGDANMGSSLANGGDLSGLGFDSLLVGMPGIDGFGGGHSLNPDSGAMFALSGPSGFQFSWFASSATNIQEGRFGTSLTAAGDTDGDGLLEFAGGEPDSALGGIQVFEVASPNGVSMLSLRSGSQAGARFGFSMSAGDFDGDGFDDIVAGEPRWDGLTPDLGRVHVYRGSPTGIGTSAAWTLVAP